jgi:2-haloalkanoic acid dehalogenase type II
LKNLDDVFSTMIIKAIILDFGGTLADGGMDWEPYHEAIKVMLMGKGYLVEMKEIKDALRATLGSLNRIRAQGKEMTFEEVYALFLRRLGVTDNEETLVELHENFKQYYKTEYFHCVEDVLKELSSNYKVALLSNTISDLPRLVLERSGYDKYFDHIACSRDLGVRKPNPQAFHMILNKLNLNPIEVVHVGDSVKADMYGACNVGITGIWIRTPNQPPWSGHTITSICELPSFLRKMECTRWI